MKQTDLSSLCRCHMSKTISDIMLQVHVKTYIVLHVLVNARQSLQADETDIRLQDLVKTEAKLQDYVTENRHLNRLLTIMLHVLVKQRRQKGKGKAPESLKKLNVTRSCQNMLQVLVNGQKYPEAI